ncbi:MAG: S8 family serine peptidase [Bdellovibrionales bacterium]
MACAKQTIVVATSPSVGSTYCSSVASSAAPSSSPTQMSAFSFGSPKITGLSQGSRVKLDTSTLRLPKIQGLGQIMPQRMAKAFSNYSEYSVPGGSRLVAVVDHECTRRHRLALNPNQYSQTISEHVMDPSVAAVQGLREGIKTLSHSISFDEDTNVEDLEALGEADPCLVMVGTEVEMKPFAVPLDPNYAALENQKMRHFDAIAYETNYDKYFDAGGINADVVIAVIDSGVRITHDDLDGSLWVNAGETPGDGIDNDANGKIDDVNGYNFKAATGDPTPQTWVGYGGAEGHGTHVAGLVAAEQNNALGGLGVIGTNGKIMSLNVFGNTPSASTSTIDNAITYAANSGAHIINLSLGGEGRTESTKTAIAAAITAGVTVVAAAGNGDSTGAGVLLTSSYFVTPASFAQELDGMISVGSFDAATGSLSSFSNCSSTYVEIAAPGAYNSNLSSGGIYSTWHTADTTFAKSNAGSPIMGTSMASPIVAGAAALTRGLYLRVNGSAPTPSQIETLILSNGTTGAGLSNYVKNGKKLNVSNIATAIRP